MEHSAFEDGRQCAAEDGVDARGALLHANHAPHTSAIVSDALVYPCVRRMGPWALMDRRYAYLIPVLRDSSVQREHHSKYR
jgi:hypothetical protein